MYPRSKVHVPDEKAPVLSRQDRKMLFWSLIFVWALVMVVLITTADKVPNCHEDQVVVWTGDEHDRCVSLDKFAPAMTDTVVVDPDHCVDTQDGYMRCEVDPAAMIGVR